MDEDQVAFDPVLRGLEQPGGRPDQPLGLALGHLSDRAGHLEVVEVFGIDGANRFRMPGLGQVGNDPAGCLTGIVPALEGSDDHGCAELTDAVELDRTPPPSRFGQPGCGCRLQTTSFSMIACYPSKLVPL